MKQVKKSIGDVTIKELYNTCKLDETDCKQCTLKEFCRVFEFEPFEWREGFIKKKVTVIVEDDCL